MKRKNCRVGVRVQVKEHAIPAETRGLVGTIVHVGPLTEMVRFPHRVQAEHYYRDELRRADK